MAREVALIFTVLTLGLSILVGITVIDAVGQSAIEAGEGGEDGYTRVTDPALLNGDQFVQVRPNRAKGRNETVYDSLGNALRLTGANDSYADGSANIQPATDETWTVHQAVAVNETATQQNMTVLAVGEPNLVVRYINDSSGAQWQAVWVGNVNQQAVNVTATNQTRLTHVTVDRNGDTLTIFENTTAGESANISVDGFDGDFDDAQTLHGTLEETRTWDRNITATERQQLVDSPIDPIANGRQARYMYDQGSGGKVRNVVTGSHATTSNARWVAGFPGQELVRADILGNGDYRWQVEGPEIKPVSGGELETAPVAWVKYDRSGMAATALSDISDVFSLANVLLVALIAIGVVTAMRFNE